MVFSLVDNYIIVNYHYIEADGSRFSGAHPCMVADFTKQLEFLSRSYRMVSVSDVFEAACNKSQGKFCALTFDDGLRGQYDYAAPLLKRAKAHGTFFIITSVLQGRLPSAHRIHVLLSHFPVMELIQLFHIFLKNFYPDLESQHKIDTKKRLTGCRLHEDIATANFKETLITLPEDIKAQFLRYCFKKFKLNADKINRDIFMGEKEIRILKKEGLEIGSHTHNHYALDAISPSTLTEDIKLSAAALLGLTNQSPAVFSYPHGRFQEAVKPVLAEAGFKYAVTIERRGLKADDDRFLIPRYDTADINQFLS